MKSLKLSFVWFLIIGCSMLIKPAYSQTQLLNSAKKIVTDYFDKNRNLITRIMPDDLNLRYKIVDILTLQRVKNSIENGKIYHCSPLGDDIVGIFLLIENDSCKLIQIHDLTDFRAAWDFMCKNGYTIDEINTSINYIINNYEYDLQITVH